MQRRRDPDAKRQAVLATANEVFAADGFNAATAEIARRAGVAEGTIFHHFGSKHGLLEALSRRIAERFIHEQRQVHNRGVDYHVLTAAAFEWLATDNVMRRLWAEGDDQVTGAIRRGWQCGIVAAMSTLLAEEQRAGRCRPGDPERLAQLQFGLMGEALVAHFGDPQGWPRDDAVHLTASMLRRAVEPD